MKILSAEKVKKLPVYTDVYLVNEKTGWKGTAWVVKVGRKKMLKGIVDVCEIRDVKGWHYEVEEKKKNLPGTNARIEFDEEVSPLEKGGRRIEELKRCPFCGGFSRLIAEYDYRYNQWYFYAECTLCGVEQKHYSRSREDAIEEWNRRSEKL